jgi:hypothetical protein
VDGDCAAVRFSPGNQRIDEEVDPADFLTRLLNALAGMNCVFSVGLAGVVEHPLAQQLPSLLRFPLTDLTPCQVAQMPQATTKVRARIFCRSIDIVQTNRKPI